MNKKLCIGLLTHCNDEVSPERFNVLKRAVSSLRMLSRDDVYIYVWDNGSSNAVKDFLRSMDFFDARYFSEKNLYDFVAVHKLVHEAKKINAEYVCHLEDDFLFYRSDFLDNCFKFMNSNTDCGYLRILKYDYYKRQIYDKFLNHPHKDEANCQRHFNQVTKAPLRWEFAGPIGGDMFYKNNWHWYNYANICRRDVFEKIIPSFDHKPLQSLEGYMIEKYHELNLGVGVLNGGVVDHIGLFNKDTSERLRIISNDKEFPVLKYDNVVKEINVLQKS